MERKLLYAFRGWIAFVAFMDLGTAFRSYIEKRSFLGDPSDPQYMAGRLCNLSLCIFHEFSYLNNSFIQVTIQYHALLACIAS